MVCSRDYRTHAAADGTSHDLQVNGEPVDGNGLYMTDLLTDQAHRVIRERDARPLFLMLAYQAPHAPIQPYLFKTRKYRDRGLSVKRASYAAMVDRLDEGVGVVLDTLDQEGMTDNTIVIFLSDNGGSLAFGASNRPFRGEKTRTFEGGIRVPAVIRYPGVLAPGRAIWQVARERDLFAPLERGAGLSLRAPAESLNIWPQLQGAPLVDGRDLFFVFRWTPTFGRFRGVLSEDGWKLVKEYTAITDPTFPPDTFEIHNTTHLFNLVDDPREERNLAMQEPDLVEELSQKFDDYAATHSSHQGIRGFTHPPEGWVKPSDLTELMAN
jgi:arylsulfatase A-like enzyme